jgi:membrane protein
MGIARAFVVAWCPRSQAGSSPKWSLAFALIYYFAPNVKRPIRSVSPGAASATLARLVFSVAFSWVMDRFGAILVDPLYGWFTGLIVLLLYLYWSAFILLVGADVNHVIEAEAGALTHLNFILGAHDEVVRSYHCAHPGY